MTTHPGDSESGCADDLFVVGKLTVDPAVWRIEVPLAVWERCPTPQHLCTWISLRWLIALYPDQRGFARDIIARRARVSRQRVTGNGNGWIDDLIRLGLVRDLGVEDVPGVRARRCYDIPLHDLEAESITLLPRILTAYGAPLERITGKDDCVVLWRPGVPLLVLESCDTPQLLCTWLALYWLHNAFPKRMSFTSVEVARRGNINQKYIYGKTKDGQPGWVYRLIARGLVTDEGKEASHRNLTMRQRTCVPYTELEAASLDQLASVLRTWHVPMVKHPSNPQQMTFDFSRLDSPVGWLTSPSGDQEMNNNAPLDPPIGRLTSPSGDQEMNNNAPLDPPIGCITSSREDQEHNRTIILDPSMNCITSSPGDQEMNNNASLDPPIGCMSSSLGDQEGNHMIVLNPPIGCMTGLPGTQETVEQIVSAPLDPLMDCMTSLLGDQEQATHVGMYSMYVGGYSIPPEEKHTITQPAEQSVEQPDVLLEANRVPNAPTLTYGWPSILITPMTLWRNAREVIYPNDIYYLAGLANEHNQTTNGYGWWYVAQAILAAGQTPTSTFNLRESARALGYLRGLLDKWRLNGYASGLSMSKAVGVSDERLQLTQTKDARPERQSRPSKRPPGPVVATRYRAYGSDESDSTFDENE